MDPAADLVWSDLGVLDLDVPTLHEILEVRVVVFVVEQKCAYQEVDGLDLLAGTRHLIGREHGETNQRTQGGKGTHSGDLVAYARVLAPDEVCTVPRIGRVLVTEPARGRQLARGLMERALACCEEYWPGERVELGAQAHLTRFYESLGFRTVGEPYDEDGIAHVWMRRDDGASQPRP